MKGTETNMKFLKVQLLHPLLSGQGPGSVWDMDAFLDVSITQCFSGLQEIDNRGPCLLGNTHSTKRLGHGMLTNITSALRGPSSASAQGQPKQNGDGERASLKSSLARESRHAGIPSQPTMRDINSPGRAHATASQVPTAPGGQV